MPLPVSEMPIRNRGGYSFDLNSDQNVVNPDIPNSGEFSDNTERFTKDKNELKHISKNLLLPISQRLYVSPSLPAGDGGLPIAPVADPDAAAMTNAPTDSDANVPNVATRVINKLLGTGGEERYKTWPEKLLRDALSAPHDVLNNTVPSTSGDLIKPALDMSALAGTGGLGGVGEGGAAALGSSPFLRPALRYEGKIYKAPQGAGHMDAIPENLRSLFTEQALNGEDISHFNFGFLNHKGHFLDREKALKYAIDEGLLDKQDAKFGALVSGVAHDMPMQNYDINGMGVR